MKLVLASLAATAAVVTPLLLSNARASAPPLGPTMLGPGAVIDAHKKLFAALDAHRADDAIALVDTTGEAGFSDGEDGGIARPSAVLVDDGGAPVLASGAEAVKKAVRDLAKEDGLPAWTTRIVRSRADCASAELSYAVLEIERTRGVKAGTKRYRSTSLVRLVDGTWRLFHWHLSPADAPETLERR